jgi:hypothetical protein
MFAKLERFSGTKPSRTPRWKQLRGMVWLDYAIHRSEITGSEFASRYLRSPSGRQTDALQRWLTGKAHPERVSAIKLERVLPGTLEVFDWPLFPLLDRAELSEAKIASLMARFVKWAYPPGLTCFEFPNASPIVWTGDSTLAVARGGIWGLTLAIWAARQAEVRFDEHAHLEHCHNMYRALPKVLQNPWVTRARPLLKECLEDVRSGFLYSKMMFDVDWDVINRQVADPTFEPCRERRPRDPRTLRFVDIEDPILPAIVIPGLIAAGLADDA